MSETRVPEPLVVCLLRPTVLYHICSRPCTFIPLYFVSLYVASTPGLPRNLFTLIFYTYLYRINSFNCLLVTWGQTPRGCYICRYRSTHIGKVILYWSPIIEYRSVVLRKLNVNVLPSLQEIRYPFLCSECCPRRVISFRTR